MIITPLNEKYKAYFSEFITEYTKAGSFFDQTKGDSETELNNFNILPEEKAKLYIDFKVRILQAMYSQASQATVALLGEEVNRDLISRQIQGFDDNLLIELTKMQGNVASFFVNSNPSGAQSVLDDLKDMMQTISQRATLLQGTQPAIPSD